MYWLMGRYSALSVYNKLMLYQQVIKPVGWIFNSGVLPAKATETLYKDFRRE
jgi:hypothetical protein